MPPLCLGVPAISCNNQVQLVPVWGLAASHPALTGQTVYSSDPWQPRPPPLGPPRAPSPGLCSLDFLPPSLSCLSSILLKWQQTDVSLCKDQMKSMALGLFTKEQISLDPMQAHTPVTTHPESICQPLQVSLCRYGLLVNRFWQNLTLQRGSMMDCWDFLASVYLCICVHAFEKSH